ncbi:MAG: carbamoyltransferase [Flavobacteriales bacterium]|nr:carbamoyltransferase [Flavobacteriales bacterium]
MKILGISAFYHDSAAAIFVDGEILAAAQEERFTRKKHDQSFPKNAIAYCLDQSGLSLDELDAIAFYDKPLLKFERLLETYYGYSPKGLISFLKSMPTWIKEKLFLKKIIKDELFEVEPFDRKKIKLLFPEHHLSHAASAFYPSPYDEAAVLTIDGVGEWATTSICFGKGKGIKVLKELRFPHSVGLLYSAFTYFLGFKVNSGEYKLMGLAPYGNGDSEQTKRFIKTIKENLIDLKPDGSIFLDQRYFNYATGLRMIYDKKWEQLFGILKRKPESPFEQVHCDLALAIQMVTEEVVIKMAEEAKRLTNSNNLCLAGGVALNCVANGKLIEQKIFENVYIQPAAGDAGGAVGSALAAEHLYFGKERTTQLRGMKGSYLGPEFDDKEVLKMSRRFEGKFEYFENFDELTKTVAELISKGNVVGWFQGRMEFGPRALGNRSILGDPRNEEMQKKLNLKIKYRESFRPFAPSVLAENVQDFFEWDGTSPFMLQVHKIKKDKRKSLPPNYADFSIKEKLYHKRSDVPSITHVDFSARIQTVHKETNPRYWQLIESFHQLTKYPLLVNTSFNVRGEPIVCTPEDAYRCLMRTEMDYLIIGNYFFNKEKQPVWKEKDNWKEQFVLD